MPPGASISARNERRPRVASPLLVGRRMPRVPEGVRHEVTIVSTNPETLDGLQTYLRGAGIDVRCTRELDDCLELAPLTTLAFVLFPDDFRWESVVATLADLATRRPEALPVLVTAHPNRFEHLTAPEEVLIVPRPVWGWTILDAVRAHQSAQPSWKGGRARAR